MVSPWLRRNVTPLGWLLIGCGVFAILHLVYWYCAVYRLNHPQIRPKLRLAAEMLAITPGDGVPIEKPADWEAARANVRVRVADSFKKVSRIYKDAQTGEPRFRFRPRSAEDTLWWDEADEDQLRDAFVDAVSDLAMCKEETREFAVALIRVAALGKFWNDGTPRNLPIWSRQFLHSYHTRQGANFGIPPAMTGDGKLRAGAVQYLQHRNAFDFWPPDDVRDEIRATMGRARRSTTTSSDAVNPATDALETSDVAKTPDVLPPHGDMRHLSRFVEQRIAHQPWVLLRWSDPGFHHNASRNPMAVLMLIVTTGFFLEFRYGGWGKHTGTKAERARTHPSLFIEEPLPDLYRFGNRPVFWPARLRRVWRLWFRKMVSENFWIGLSLIVVLGILVFGESHETWPEWIVSFTMLPIAAVLIPVLICSLAAMVRTSLTLEFQRLSPSKRLKKLSGFAVGAGATLVMAAWIAYYSLFGLVLSFDAGRTARGAIQLFVAGLLIFWLVRLISHLLGTPTLPATDDPAAPPSPSPRGDASNAGEFSQTLSIRLLQALTLVLLPFAGKLVEQLFGLIEAAM